jgi:hypothetical protein
MRTLRRPVFTIAAIMFLTVVPAMAAVYTIHLKNGNSFDSRYKPRVAGWDENKIMVTTDIGNRITLQRDDVVDITVDTEAKGFGTVLDTTTIVLGWAPNDAPVPGEGGEDPGVAMMRALQERGGRPDYSVQQFVEPSEAGGSGGGLPAWEFGGGTFGGGYGGGRETVIVAPPARRAPSTPPPVGGPAGGAQPNTDG